MAIGSIAASLGMTALVEFIGKLKAGDKNAWGQVLRAPGKAMTKGAPSLTMFGRQANIMGRVYIEDSIAQDDIAIPLMGVLNQMYVCWIITALGLDSICADGRTVRDRLAMVAGEEFVDDLIANIKDSFGSNKENKISVSNEAKLVDMDSEAQRLACGRLIELDFNIGAVSVQTTSGGGTKTSGTTSTNGTTSMTGNSNNYSVADTTGDQDNHTTITNANNKSNSTTTTNSTTTSQTNTTRDNSTVVTSNINAAYGASLLRAYVYVQMIPYILQQEVAGGFMGVNFAPSASTRWKQLRAGEISFVKDFIFARDLIKKQAQLLKRDNTGIIAEMMARQRNALFKWATGLTGILPERHNLANAILIMNKQTFDQSCRDAHVDFDNRLAREKFFLKTFSMVMVVVDPLYGNVKMYFAGIPAVATYSYAMINKVGAKGKDSFDLKEIMTAMAQGQTPRF